MSSLLVYATRLDAELIRTWINESSEVAWLVKTQDHDCRYEWKAFLEIESLQQQAYAIWHLDSGPLNIPSGVVGAADTIIDDPFQGWSQILTHPGATRPWFGGNLPGPYSFTFAEDGCEASGNLARSEFSWLADRYKSIGKPAHPSAKKWWQKLRLFIEHSTIAVPWVESLNNRKSIPMVYLFPDAAQQLYGGRGRDINPWSRHRVA
jgi:hypothetical protein